jgi:hypothetical protein
MNPIPSAKFNLPIHHHSGEWPKIPELWSYSTLKEVENCTRLYSLKRATYPKIWNRKGYPELLWPKTVYGNVIHKCLEEIQNTINATPHELSHAERLVSALRTLGGHLAILNRFTESELSSLEENPRSESLIPDLRLSLQQKQNEMRLDLQIRISKIPAHRVPEVAGSSRDTNRSQNNQGLWPASHPEVWLKSSDLRFLGQVDLLTIKNGECEILDYKTGRPKPEHKQQLELYALLWARDIENNPRKIPIKQLSIQYTDTAETHDPPSSGDLDQLESALQKRISLADNALKKKLPLASPSENCRLCPVRHLCDEYWQSEFSHPQMKPVFSDIELTVNEECGPRSWHATSNHFQNGLVITTSINNHVVALKNALNKKMRLLGVTIQESDGGALAIHLSKRSEVWLTTEISMLPTTPIN